MSKAKGVILGVLLYSCLVFAQQTVGEIFTKQAALEKFGAVTFSTSMKTAEFSDLFVKSNLYMMFKIKDGKIYIFDNNRKALTPSNITFAASEELRVFSISKIKELIQRGNESITNFELRGSLLTISNGVYVMDISMPCPPTCL